MIPCEKFILEPGFCISSQFPRLDQQGVNRRFLVGLDVAAERLGLGVMIGPPPALHDYSTDQFMTALF